ncbi:unnamed protein product [Tetraodon nigroviridis]|uniref:(spotted green pufferfish) hypothetical protein n=1 Tax=Tetraodon nigroviridis TaxID=99883 RepID=Q4RNV6_TETNG|nr:unnamed protein product [Tetraodon nigroviridis]
MFRRLQRLTPGYIRLLQTQAYHNVPATPPAEKTVPGMAVLLGAVGIGMCGYSSRQLALHHRPSARVLQLVGTHTDANAVGTAAQRSPFLDAARRAGACQEIPAPYFVGPKRPMCSLVTCECGYSIDLSLCVVRGLDVF